MCGEEAEPDLFFIHMNEKKAFTLIELIIVVVIIGILALIAIPKYYASVNKAKKKVIYANLDAIRKASLAYYAVYGKWNTNNVWPIEVIVDGDTIISQARPNQHGGWLYYCTQYGDVAYGGYLIYAYNGTCELNLGVSGWISTSGSCSGYDD